MSYNLDFPDLPPFPSNVPTAPLLRLSLQKLLDDDDNELQTLWKACSELGFFYLDLRNAKGHVPSHAPGPDENLRSHTDANQKGSVANGPHSSSIDGNQFVANAYSLFEVAEEFYSLPAEEKIKYDLKDKGSYHGYKGYGDGIIDKQGSRDRVEFYNISKDDILSISERLPSPDVLTPHRPLMQEYIVTAHAIVTLILTHLNTLLHLPTGILPSLNDLHSPSGDQTRIVRSPPQPPTDSRTALGAHTDFGSVTLLFNRLGGLQILPPETDSLSEEAKLDRWVWVRPLPGHCIVNLGDAMVKFTRGLLRSNIHRVVNPPGEKQGKLTRMSLVYFSRPVDDVLLKPLEGSDIVDARKGAWEDDGKVVSSKNCVLQRALGRRDGKWVEGTAKARGMREVEVS